MQALRTAFFACADDARACGGCPESFLRISLRCCTRQAARTAPNALLHDMGAALDPDGDTEAEPADTDVTDDVAVCEYEEEARPSCCITCRCHSTMHLARSTDPMRVVQVACVCAETTVIVVKSRKMAATESMEKRIQDEEEMVISGMPSRCYGSSG